MAILHFTPGDALQGLKMDAGAYGATLQAITGPTPSKSGKGHNFIFKFVITAEGKYKGKELEVMLSTGMREGNVLGNLQLIAKSDVLLIEAAIKDTQVSITEKDLELDSLVGGSLDLLVGVQATDNGTGVMNVITGFAPLGKGVGGPVF